LTLTICFLCTGFFGETLDNWEGFILVPFGADLVVLLNCLLPCLGLGRLFQVNDKLYSKGKASLYSSQNQVRCMGLAVKCKNNCACENGVIKHRRQTEEDAEYLYTRDWAGSRTDSVDLVGEVASSGFQKSVMVGGPIVVSCAKLHYTFAPHEIAQTLAETN
jgi:hypothetical protein